MKAYTKCSISNSDKEPHRSTEMGRKEEKKPGTSPKNKLKEKILDIMGPWAKWKLQSYESEEK